MVIEKFFSAALWYKFIYKSYSLFLMKLCMTLHKHYFMNMYNHINNRIHVKLNENLITLIFIRFLIKNHKLM